MEIINQIIDQAREGLAGITTDAVLVIFVMIALVAVVAGVGYLRNLFTLSREEKEDD